MPNASKKRYKRSKNLKKVALEPTPVESPEQSNLIPAVPVAAPFDTEVAQDIVFQPNAGPQTEFLSSSEREVLYGGAAGGGKSYAMLADPLHGLNSPNFSGLIQLDTLRIHIHECYLFVGAQKSYENLFL